MINDNDFLKDFVLEVHNPLSFFIFVAYYFIKMVKQVITLAIFFLVFEVKAQQTPSAPTPPMGFMTWNYFGVDFNEDDIKEMADAMLETGLVKLGYNYICIDDGWQGGRDAKNNMIADSKNFLQG